MARVPGLLAAIALAGCTAPSLPGPAGEVPLPGALPEGFEVPVRMTGCTEIAPARLVPLEHARSLLPPGFEPGDAAGFLGYPAPVGRGFVASGLLRCGASDLDAGPVEWADLIVYVRTPEVPGRDLAEGYHDFYQLAHFTSGPRHRELLASAGMPSFGAAVDLGREGPLEARGTLDDGEGLLVELRTPVAEAGPAQYPMRFWHQAEAGLLLFQFERTPVLLHLGTPVACTLRAGSLHAQAFGGTDCRGADALAALFPNPSDIAGSLAFEPGAEVAAGP